MEALTIKNLDLDLIWISQSLLLIIITRVKINNLYL